MVIVHFSMAASQLPASGVRFLRDAMNLLQEFVNDIISVCSCTSVGSPLQPFQTWYDLATGMLQFRANGRPLAQMFKTLAHTLQLQVNLPMMLADVQEKTRFSLKGVARRQFSHSIQISTVGEQPIQSLVDHALHAANLTQRDDLWFLSMAAPSINDAICMKP